MFPWSNVVILQRKRGPDVISVQRKRKAKERNAGRNIMLPPPKPQLFPRKPRNKGRNHPGERASQRSIYRERNNKHSLWTSFACRREVEEEGQDHPPPFLRSHPFSHSSAPASSDAAASPSASLPVSHLSFAFLDFFHPSSSPLDAQEALPSSYHAAPPRGLGSLCTNEELRERISCEG
ncbi:uncharacterized protein LOC103718649 isoform X1 [Phoenix dactylifera]|uniref:Uncharacterized protein LOC103718649 isoform X1 n=1 Tax=Phoenix dactylifera TaxID=42345 RepID=A0A8B7CSU7_PHODC|nr:uncharacterized protein LOC103718649 isoform X1 [Phoenix dactylifera]